MVRAISLLGFGGVFLLISPDFRGSVLGGLATGVNGLNEYSPWSYVACAAVGLVLATISLNRASRPR